MSDPIKRKLVPHPKFRNLPPGWDKNAHLMEPELLQEILTGNCYRCGTPLEHYGGPVWACPKCMKEFEERYGKH